MGAKVGLPHDTDGGGGGNAGLLTCSGSGRGLLIGTRPDSTERTNECFAGGNGIKAVDTADSEEHKAKLIATCYTFNKESMSCIHEELI